MFRVLVGPGLVDLPHSYIRPCTSPCQCDPRTPADDHETDNTNTKFTWMTLTSCIVHQSDSRIILHTDSALSQISICMKKSIEPVHLWNPTSLLDCIDASSVPEARKLWPVYRDRPSPSLSPRWLSTWPRGHDPCRYEPTPPSANKKRHDKDKAVTKNVKKNTLTQTFSL